MSFLPYAKPSSAVWAASVTGSSALHLGLVALLLTSSVAFLPVPVRNEPRAPDFEVTLEILDADIIDLTDPEPEDQLVPPGAVPLSPDETVANLLQETSDTALAPDDQDVTPLQNDPSDLLQPDVSAPIEAEILTPIDQQPTDLSGVAEPLAPVALPDPDVISIGDISPIDTTEISPFAVPVAPIAQPDVVTLTPDVTADEQITALVLPDETPPPSDTPETLLPSILAPDDVAEPETTAPPAGVPDPEQSQEPPAVAANPDAPRAVANPDPQTAMIGTLIQRIRATPAVQCTLALPRRAGPDGVGVSFIGGQDAGLDAFAGRLFDGLSPVPVQTREIIDQRQCALLDAVRQVADYPAGRIGLALDDTTLRSGENLRGRVVGAGGLFVTLLLIDDNGVVQDLSRFTTLEGNDPVFDAPVARAGATRATRQIILALGSDVGPIDVSGQIGQEAEAVFSALPTDVLNSAVFGLATFDVR